MCRIEKQREERQWGRGGKQEIKGLLTAENGFVKSMVSATQETNLSANAHTLQEAWTEKDKTHTSSRGKVDFGTPPFSASKIDSLPGGSHRQTQKQKQKNRK